MVLVFADPRENEVVIVTIDQLDKVPQIVKLAAIARNGFENARDCFGYLTGLNSPQVRERRGDEPLQLHELPQSILVAAFTRAGVNNAAGWVQYFLGIGEYSKYAIQRDVARGHSQSISSRGSGSERGDSRSDASRRSDSQRSASHKDHSHKESSHKESSQRRQHHKDSSERRSSSKKVEGQRTPGKQAETSEENRLRHRHRA